MSSRTESAARGKRHFIGLVGAAVLALMASAPSCSEEGKGGPVDPVAGAPGSTEASTAAGALQSAEVDPLTGRRVNVKAPPLPALPDVVASVEGVPIRRVDFEDALVRRFEGQTFALMTLVWLEAYRDFGKKSGLEVTEKEIDAAVSEIVASQQLPDVNALLKIKCFDLPYLRKQVEFRVWVERLSEHLELSKPGVPVRTTDPRVLEAVQTASDVKMRANSIPDDAFAVVNGRPVPQKDVVNWSVLYSGPNEVATVLDELISNEVDRQQIARAGIDPKDMEFNEAGDIVRKPFDQVVEANRAMFKARGADWDRTVALKGQTVEQWVATLKRLEGVKELIKREATEDLLRQFFEENKDMLLLGEQFHIAALTVDEIHLRKPREGATDESKAAAKNRIDEARAALDEGMSFEDALQKFGTHKEHVAKIGDLGWFNLYQADSVEIRNSVVALEVGETSAPFEYNDAWHITKLVEKRDAAVADRVLKRKDLRSHILERLAMYGQPLWRDPIKARLDIRLFADLPLPYKRG